MSAKAQVLIVDDDADVRDGVSRWLHAAGYQTLMADDGEKGVESAVHHSPQAILLDVLMPRKDGMETLAALRSDQSTARIPVVMLSASLRDEQKALDAGARFFIQKPYDGKKLVAAVGAAIEKNQQN